jgi:crotonobetainyl-CoA:carnitine CoA-transferase CaiB-like acyl-CoA transferase
MTSMTSPERAAGTFREPEAARSAQAAIDPSPVSARPEPAGPQGPLRGLRVLDIATIYAGPLAGTLLGDFGALSGFAHMTGDTDGPPTLPPFGLADGLAGLAGALSVLFALRHRDAASGRGQVIDMALIEPILTVLGPGPSAYDQLGVVQNRHGNRSPNNAPATPT